MCEFSHPTWAPFRTVYVEYLMRALPPVARKVSSAPEAYVYLAESIRAWPTQPELAAQIAAGRLDQAGVAQPLRRDRRAAPGHRRVRPGSGEPSPAAGPSIPARLAPVTELRTTTHGRVVRTVTLDGIQEELLGLLPATGGHAWVRDGAGFVGWGEAARFTISGPERFSRAQRWWSAWCEAAHVEDQVGVRGSGPVAFASFTFDSGPQESVVIVPAVVVGHRAGTDLARRPSRPTASRL